MIKINKSQWKTYKFGDIASSISERAEPKETKLDIYVGLEHLDPDCIHIKRKGHPSDVKGTKLRVYPGDIIFGKRRAYQRKAAIVDFDGICSAHAMVVRANPKVILPELMPFFIHSDVFMHRAVDVSEGSLSPTIKWKILAEQVFRIPPLGDQKFIADLLWSIDEAKEKGLNAIECLSRTEGAVLQLFLRDQPKIRRKKLREISSLITKGTTPTTAGFKFLDEGINFIKAESISEKNTFLADKLGFISKECQESFQRSQLCENDILFSIAGVIGRCAIVSQEYLPANINQALALIRLSDKGVDPQYVMIILTSQYVMNHFNRIAVKTAQINVNLEQIGDLEMPVPDSFVQHELVNKIQRIKTLRRNFHLNMDQIESIGRSIVNQIFG